MEEINGIISTLETAIEAATANETNSADQAPGSTTSEPGCFWDGYKDQLFWERGLLRAKRLWLTKGITGLISGLRSLAEDQKNVVGDASAGHIEGDVNADVPPVLTYYLWSMHPLFLDGVLSGELTRKLYSTEGHQLRSVVSRYHSLDNYPGIYLNVYSRKPYPAAENTQVSASPWAGFGFTPREYEQICNKIRLYLGESSDSVEYARHIDCVHNPTKDRDRELNWDNPNGIDYSLGQRRYTRSMRGPEIILEWVEVIEINILLLRDALGHEDTPIARCITEVGWGRQCQQRASQHLIHDGTNSLFGVVTAVAEFEYPGQFATEQFQMARLKDGEDVAPMEVYCSMIASSYWFNGGANPYPAGGMSQSGKASVRAKALDAAYARNARINERNGPFEPCLKAEREKQNRSGDLFKSTPEVRQKVATLKREIVDELKKAKGVQANLRVEEALAPLRQAYQAFREYMHSLGNHVPMPPLSFPGEGTKDLEGAVDELLATMHRQDNGDAPSS